MEAHLRLSYLVYNITKKSKETRLGIKRTVNLQKSGSSLIKFKPQKGSSSIISNSAIIGLSSNNRFHVRSNSLCLKDECGFCAQCLHCAQNADMHFQVVSRSRTRATCCLK